jgi:hypothetical protein
LIAETMVQSAAYRPCFENRELNQVSSEAMPSRVKVTPPSGCARRQT